MSSKYYEWLARNEKPAPERELTPAEKRRNWWHYYKWHVLVAAILLGIVCDIGWNLLSSKAPDCQVAYVGANLLPEDTVAALEASLSGLCGDLNGDGKEQVQLVQYVTSGDSAYSSGVLLTSDILECESYLFLLEDPAWFQESFHSLRRLDGSLPEQEDRKAEGTWVLWEQCPVLANLDLGNYSYRVLDQTISGSSQELVRGLSVARRGFWTEKTVLNPEGCDAFWETLTEGAIS